MSRSPAAIVDAQIDAYVARDIDRFCALYTHDAEAWELPSGRCIASGNDEFRSVWSKTFARGERRFKRLNRLVQGRFVTDHEYLEDVATGHTFDAVVIYLVGNEAIEKVWFLAEPGQ